MRMLLLVVLGISRLRADIVQDVLAASGAGIFSDLLTMRLAIEKRAGRMTVLVEEEILVRMSLCATL
jgi:hypothetical protein